MNWYKKLLFTFWYYRNPPWDTNQTPPELFDFIANHPPGKALDLGCGTGTNAITLAQYGWQVSAIDFVAKPILLAKSKAAKMGVAVDFRVGDVTKLHGFQDKFDLILDIGCYHSLDLVGKMAYRDHINRLLAPGGNFLIYAFFKPEGSDSFSGLVAADLEPFATFLELISQQEGTERGVRKAVWLSYQKTI